MENTIQNKNNKQQQNVIYHMNAICYHNSNILIKTLHCYEMYNYFEISDFSFLRKLTSMIGYVMLLVYKEITCHFSITEVGEIEKKTEFH